MTLRHHQLLSVLNLGHDLIDLVDVGADFQPEAARRLSLLLNAEISAYTELNTTARRAAIKFPSENLQPVDERVVGETLVDNPIATYWAREPRPGPVRVSDLVSDRAWKSTATYALVLAPLGTSYMLGLPIMTAAAGGPSYAFSRAQRDFTLEEVEVSTYVQVALSMVHRHHQARNGPQQRLAMFSTREREVLALLDAGLSARRIGTQLSISTRTVEKHLEHIYAKLGVQDRLSAINAVYRSNAERPSFHRLD